MNTRFFRIITTAVVVLFTIVSCSAPEEASIESIEVVQFYDYNEIEIQTLALINNYRSSLGLNELERINHISYKSLGHTEFMVETNIIGHTNFAERQQNLHKALGALKVGENVAFNFDNPIDAIEAWKLSISHNANLIGDYTHFGISVRENQNGQNFYTNIFIKI